jgi:hypothetical protein
MASCTSVWMAWAGLSGLNGLGRVAGRPSVSQVATTNSLIPDATCVLQLLRMAHCAGTCYGKDVCILCLGTSAINQYVRLGPGGRYEMWR